MTDSATPSRFILNADGIRVTREIADIRGTSYPINGIGSVRVVAPQTFAGFLVGVLFILIPFMAGAEPGAIAIAIIIGVAILLLTFARPHVLVIHTASSDRPALRGKKEALLKVKSAIEEAVTMRG